MMEVSQKYYWTEEWQRGEAEALAEKMRGETVWFANTSDALKWLTATYDDLCREHGWDALREEPLEKTDREKLAEVGRKVEMIREESAGAERKAAGMSAAPGNPLYERGRADAHRADAELFDE